MNTEQRYLLAVALCFLVLMVFYTPLFRDKTSNQPEQNIRQEIPFSEVQNIQPQTVADAEIKTATPDEEKIFDLENNALQIRLTNQGAAIQEMLLKGDRRDQTKSTFLIQNTNKKKAFSSDLGSQAPGFESATFELEKLDNLQKEASFVLEKPGEWKVRKRYRLLGEKPAFNLTIEIENISASEKPVTITLPFRLQVGNGGGQYAQDQWESFVVPRMGKITVRKAGSLKKKPFMFQGDIDWQALTRQYVALIVKPENTAVFSASSFIESEHVFESELGFSPKRIGPGGKEIEEFLVYAGREYYEDLKSFKSGFEQTLTQGMWGIFRYWLFISLQLCERLTGGYGYAILLMTFLIKVLFSPLTHMSFESMRKMQVVQPKLKAIQTQFKNDPARLNKEMTELYKRHKVNPMGGCLPMFLQIPIFIGFYQVLAQFVELKGQSLWWIKDLTEPDRLAKIPYLGWDANLLPILMIGTMIWQQKVTPQQSFGSPDQAKMMQYMPVLFGIFFYQLPSGLVLYWTLNNLLTVIHQTAFHKKSSLPEPA